MEILQLVYLSTCSSRVDIEAEGESIARSAVQANSRLNVSGALIYCQGHFIQLLEGRPEEVYTVFGKIAADKRHYNICTILRQPATKRLFEDWSMQYRYVSERLLNEIRDVLTWNSILMASPNGTQLPPKAIINFFIRFRDECECGASELQVC